MTRKIKLDEHARALILKVSLLVSVAGLIVVLVGLNNTPVLLVGITLSVASLLISIFMPRTAKDG